MDQHIEGEIEAEDVQVHDGLNLPLADCPPLRFHRLPLKDGRDDHFENSVSPIRGRLAIQSLSKAFRRTSTSLPVARQAGPLSPIHPESQLGRKGSLGNEIRGRESQYFPNESDEEQFVFDHFLDHDYNPGPFISSISFSKYRSHGMRRSVGEGQHSRFVTPERLYRLLCATRSRYIDSSVMGASPNTERSRDGLNTGVFFRQSNLIAVGFSEYMDSAISKEVLNELLLRGGVEAEYEVYDSLEQGPYQDLDYQRRGRERTRKHLPMASEPPSRRALLPRLQIPTTQSGTNHSSGSAESVTGSVSGSAVHIERRLESSLCLETPIEALDLCGCVSSRFRAGLHEFIKEHDLSAASLEAPLKGFDSVLSDPRPRLRSTIFPHLTRLGLSNMLVLNDTDLANFISGFVYLLDLDLSFTRAGPIVLRTLQRMKKSPSGQSVRLSRPSFRSLNLAKCRQLTNESLVGFLCGDVGQDEGSNDNRWEDPLESIGELEELSIYGDETAPNRLGLDGLRRILKFCPCLLSGRLTTLDLSSVDLDDRDIDLVEEMPDQPSLLQFGIGSCPYISLKTISRLLREKMRSVEVLDISWSCLRSRQRSRLEEVPGHYYLQSFPALSLNRLHEELIDDACKWKRDELGRLRRMSNLRVVELEDASLKVLAGGAKGWNVAFGKGPRGWYVDLTVTAEVVKYTAPGSSGFEANESGGNLTKGFPDGSIRYKRVLRPLRLGQKRNNERDRVEKHGFTEAPTDRIKLALHGREEQDDGHDDRNCLEASLLAIKGSDGTIRHGEIGWMSRKTEILYGTGMLGRQDGLYGFHAYSST